MKPYRDWRLRSKIIFAAVIPFVLACVISTPFITNKSIESAESKAKAYVEEMAYRNANEIKAEIENTADAVRILSQVLEGVKISGSAKREDVNLILKNIAKKNKGILGVWTVWEKNAFDDSDSNYMNTSGHDGSGRFIPYWTKESGELKLRSLKSYNNEGAYHHITKDSGSETLMSPYKYPVNGEEKMITTISHPIYDSSGKFLATVGMDMELTQFQERISKIKPFGTGYSAIISNNGKYVANIDPSKNGESIELAKYHWGEVQKYINEGRQFSIEEIDDNLKQTVYRILVPIQVGLTDTPWAFAVTLPFEPIRAEIYQNISISILVLGVCLLWGVAFSLVTAKNIATPIATITEALEKISAGVENVKIPETHSYDEIGQMAESAVIFKANAEELITAKQNAEAANKAKSEFLANMSHELRTPMHAMLSYSKMGLDKTEDNESKIFKYFNNIYNSGERLLRLVNDLLDLSKLEAGHTEFAFVKADITKCIDEVSSELSSLLDDKKLVICIDNKLEDNNLVHDYSKIVQVLVNVVSNAIKFSPESSKIYLDIEEHDIAEKKGILISIKDEGIGIPEDELDSVFDKFVQSSKTNKGSGGTGLGLSICYSIIQAHKGKIWAENGEGNGAIIKILLPRDMNLLGGSEENDSES